MMGEANGRKAKLGRETGMSIGIGISISMRLLQANPLMISLAVSHTGKVWAVVPGSCLDCAVLSSAILRPPFLVLCSRA